METILIMVVAFIGYIIAYNTYGKHLAQRIFELDTERQTPSQTQEDGVDYVPTSKQVIFGHHFTSIAGTGPIVGPAIGIIWGWVPALLWVFFGAIFMGAVHDFGALIVSLRNQGHSLADITGRIMNRHLRNIFFVIVFLSLLIVIAIFGLVIALLFNMYPQSVFPVWMEIPIAMTLGWVLYKRGVNLMKATALAVFAMYVTVWLGHYLPLDMPSIGGIPATGVWTVVLLAYAFIASTLPVTVLLQPRDFINAWQLFIAMGLLILGVLAAHPPLIAPAYNPAPPEAPSLVPFLFITIACGAVSGFHSLVAGGTSSKQVSSEPDAQLVGYGSMLTESFLAVLVIIACGAGLGIAYTTGDGTVLTGDAAFSQHYATWSAAKGLGSKVAAFVVGSANMIAALGISKELAIIIMGVFVASFAGTTLDTATRLQRYVITELASDFNIRPLTNRYVATGIAVVTAAALAFYNGAGGKGALTLWPLFGAVNQLLAGLALVIVAYYLKTRGKSCLYALIPALLVLCFTSWSLVLTLGDMYRAGNVPSFLIGSVALVLEIWLAIEALLIVGRTRTVASQVGG